MKWYGCEFLFPLSIIDAGERLLNRSNAAFHFFRKSIGHFFSLDGRRLKVLKVTHLSLQYSYYV